MNRNDLAFRINEIATALYRAQTCGYQAKFQVGTLILSSPRTGSNYISSLLWAINRYKSEGRIDWRNTLAHPELAVSEFELFSTQSLAQVLNKPCDRGHVPYDEMSEAYATVENMCYDDAEKLPSLKLSAHGMIHYHSTQFIVNCIMGAKRIIICDREDRKEQFASYVIACTTKQWKAVSADRKNAQPIINPYHIPFFAETVASAISFMEHLKSFLYVIKWDQMQAITLEQAALWDASNILQNLALMKNPADHISSFEPYLQDGNITTKLVTSEEKHQLIKQEWFDIFSNTYIKY